MPKGETEGKGPIDFVNEGVASRTMPCFQGSEIFFVGAASCRDANVAGSHSHEGAKACFFGNRGRPGRDEALLDRLLQVAVVAVQGIDRRERIVSEHAILGRQHRTGRLAVFENQRIVAHTQAEQHIEMGLG